MANRIRSWIADSIAANLFFPQKGPFGWLALKMLERRNGFLELGAVRLCNIKPDQNVLEIGFGPGLGLEATYQIVKNGKGKVFGVEPSFYMVETASKRLKKAIQEKKVTLFNANVSQIPLNTDSVHRVFHCNCYYFWPSMRAGMREIYRVMKPGGIMVTTLCFENLKKSQERGFLKFGNPDPVKYMSCLEKYGFENVHLEYHTDPVTGKQFQAIFSEVIEKPAHHKAIYSIDDDDTDDNSNSVQKELTMMMQSKAEQVLLAAKHSPHGDGSDKLKNINSPNIEVSDR